MGVDAVAQSAVGAELKDGVSLTAVAQADSYSFRWSLGLAQDTLHKRYAAFHATVATLHYPDYTETVSDEERL